MLTIWGGKQRFCDGLTRRNFLKIGAFGAGLSLADMCRGSGPSAPASNKAAIMIYLAGGPPHIDMYDLKPDAPVEYRGEFKPIKTNVPGVEICELFPRQARMWDKLACIRTIVCGPQHSDSEVHTGYSFAENRTAHHPSFGAVVSKLRADSKNNNGIPPFVSLRKPRPADSPSPEFTQGLKGGFLGEAHRAFEPSGRGMADLLLGDEVSLDRLEDRRKLLASFDSLRRDIDASGAMQAMDGHTVRALDLVVSGKVSKALDLRHEDARTRTRYKGVETFLLARRLVEAGVGFVSIGIGGWDTHGGNFPIMRRLLPQMDLGVTNLVQDLCDRGMDKDVVTIMWGEFGRAPKINPSTNKLGPGRNHWPQVSSALVAGGGLKMGQVIGSTTARAENPKDRPYRVQQVLATLYLAMGIDPSLTFPNNGRPVHLLDDRDPVKELL